MHTPLPEDNTTLHDLGQCAAARSRVRACATGGACLAQPRAPELPVGGLPAACLPGIA